MRRAAAAIAGVALLLAGCAPQNDPEVAAPEVWIDEPDVSTLAAELFPEPDLDQAYEMVTDFALDRGFDPALMDPQRSEYAAEDLNAGVVGRVSPELEQRWLARVDAALAGNVNEQDAARILQFYKWDQPTWSIGLDGEHVLNEWIRDAKVDGEAATDESVARIKVTFVHQASLRYQEDGAPFDLEMTKQMTYWLVPAAEGAEPAWLVDAYEGAFEVRDEDEVRSVASSSPTPGTPTPATATPSPGAAVSSGSVGAVAPAES